MLAVAVDCRKISDGGIGTYITNLLRSWKRQKAEARFYLFSQSDDLSRLDEFKEFAEIIIHDYPKYSISELFSFSKPLKRHDIDIFFCPHYTLPFNLPCPSVVTIHDLIHLRMPVKGGFLGRLYAKSIIKHACKNCNAIITVSEFSKGDIAELFPNCPQKIEIVYNGIDKSFFRPLPEEKIESFREEYSLWEKFILYVGALKNHKNPGALSLAVKKLSLPLVVLTNSKSEFETKLLSTIENKNLVRLIQLENDHDIALLYNSATVLFHPSLYEGFGLPPLEAMSCGLPVVCSNRASLPEIVGNAAVCFDPDDTEAMLGELRSVWENRELRIKLSAAGLQRSAGFNWDYTATRTFDILRSVAGK